MHIAGAAKGRMRETDLAVAFAPSAIALIVLIIFAVLGT
jgi:hypothetical protein